MHRSNRNWQKDRSLFWATSKRSDAKDRVFAWPQWRWCAFWAMDIGCDHAILEGTTTWDWLWWVGCLMWLVNSNGIWVPWFWFFARLLFWIGNPLLLVFGKALLSQKYFECHWQKVRWEFLHLRAKSTFVKKVMWTGKKSVAFNPLYSSLVLKTLLSFICFWLDCTCFWTNSMGN